MALETSYVIEPRVVKLMVRVRDRKELDRYSQVVEIPGPHGGRGAEGLVLSVGVVIVRHDEQSPGEKVGGLGREDLIRTEQHVGHRHRLGGWNEHVPCLSFVVCQPPQLLDFVRRGHIQIGEEVAVGVGEIAPAGLLLVVELGRLRPVQEDPHHIVRVGDDALLHQVVGAFQRGRGGRLLALRFRIGGRTGGQHRLVDLDGEEDGVLDGFIALQHLPSSERPVLLRR